MSEPDPNTVTGFTPKAQAEIDAHAFAAKTGGLVNLSAPTFWELFEAAKATGEARAVCQEAYAALGSLLFDMAERGHPQAEKLLDNLSEARLVHSDVLPFADPESTPNPDQQSATAT